MVDSSFADETAAYIQGWEPIIWLNTHLRIVVVVTDGAVITGIAASEKYLLAMVRFSVADKVG